VCCSVLQCVAVCCSVLQCAAVCCSVLHCFALFFSVLQCAAVCCSVLQGVAVCCSMLQCKVCACHVCTSLSVLTSLNFCIPNDEKRMRQNTAESNWDTHYQFSIKTLLSNKKESTMLSFVASTKGQTIGRALWHTAVRRTKSQRDKLQICVRVSKDRKKKSEI